MYMTCVHLTAVNMICDSFLWVRLLYVVVVLYVVLYALCMCVYDFCMCLYHC